MSNDQIVIFIIFFLFALLEIFKTSFFRKKGATKDDNVVDVVSALLVIGFLKPSAVAMGAWLMSVFAPQYNNVLSGLPIWAGFILLLFCDDLVNYFWHRNAHRRPIFYKLHRPHHNGEYISIRLVFRNNAFYFLLAPYYWISGILLFMGLGTVLAIYLVVKLLITISVHSDIPWDKPLYENKWTSPVMWLVERIIVTPSFHHAHHGKHKSDGVTNYKGN